MKVITSSSFRSGRFRGPRRAAGGAAPWLAAVLCAFTSLAAARPIPQVPETSSDEPAPTAHVAQRGAVSLQQATAMAQNRLGGKVVKAETRNRGGRVEHEIRILVDGRVRTVRIDAQTGQFL